jgi:hypothetical protein
MEFSDYVIPGQQHQHQQLIDQEGDNIPALKRRITDPFILYGHYSMEQQQLQQEGEQEGN